MSQPVSPSLDCEKQAPVLSVFPGVAQRKGDRKKELVRVDVHKLQENDPKGLAKGRRKKEVSIIQSAVRKWSDSISLSPRSSTFRMASRR